MSKKILWGTLFSYILVCFGLVLYPPFQIACGLVLTFLLFGYIIDELSRKDKIQLIKNLLILLVSIIVSIGIIIVFLATRYDVVKTIAHTSYPGSRVLTSGGISPYHFFSSHLQYQFTSASRTSKYLINDISPSNQSEVSNFLLISPFLILPAIVLLSYEKIKKLKTDWPLLMVCVIFLIFLMEMFFPTFSSVSKLFLLDKVGSSRVLIGFGLLNFILFILLIRNLTYKDKIPHLITIFYSLLVLIVELFVSLHAYSHFIGFISIKRAVLFSIPIPMIIYFLLRRKILLSVLIYALFSIFISIRVNPLYVGLGEVYKGSLSSAIKAVNGSSQKGWITDNIYLENITSLNGVKSISGVYDYPQFKLWQNIPNVDKYDYNRYAHVKFNVITNNLQDTTLSLTTPDSFVVTTNPCGDYLKSVDAGFMILTNRIDSNCATLTRTLVFPAINIYIYKLKT